MGRKVADLIGAALLVALGFAFAGGALSGLEVFREGGRIGPGFMPFFAGAMLVVFGAMIGIGAWLGGRRGPGEGSPGDEPEGAQRTVAAVFLLSLAAILLIPLIGFLPAFGLLIFALVRFVEGRGLLLAAGTGVGGVIFAWVVFVLFLKIPLPGGVFVAGG